MNVQADPLAEVDALITKGKFDAARLKAERNTQDETLRDNVTTWFQLALAYRLLFMGTAATAAQERARQCEGYNDVMHGDFLRDGAIMLIKQGKYEQALDYINEAERLHRGDVDRQNCLMMVRGRLLARSGDSEAAYWKHVSADEGWKRLGAAGTEQWRINNRLHWMIAAMLSGRRMDAWRILPRLLWTDRKARKLAGLVICLGGKRGAKYVLNRY